MPAGVRELSAPTLDEVRDQLAQVLRNDLGLLSEEYEPRSGRLIGNFPQAFSHLALIQSARLLGAEQK